MGSSSDIRKRCSESHDTRQERGRADGAKSCIHLTSKQRERARKGRTGKGVGCHCGRGHGAVGDNKIGEGRGETEHETDAEESGCYDGNNPVYVWVRGECKPEET